MNKYQEALKKLCGRCHKDTTEHKEVLQELIDRATPKKPVVVLDDDEGEYGERLIYAEYCPACSEDLTKVGGAYCHNCGQRIDWRS